MCLSQINAPFFLIFSTLSGSVSGLIENDLAGEKRISKKKRKTGKSILILRNMQVKDHYEALNSGLSDAKEMKKP